MPGAPRDYGRHLYLISALDDSGAGCCKIGRSSNCARRLNEVQRYMPWLRATLVARYENQGWQERRIHARLTDARVGTSEWFRVPAEEAKAAIEGGLVPDLPGLLASQDPLAKLAWGLSAQTCP